MEVHIKISYQYRDAGNNKNYREIVLENPSRIFPDFLISLFRDAFIEDQQYSDLIHFRPEEVGLPTLYFERYDPDLDISLHELQEVSLTSERATLNITVDQITDFIKRRNKR